MFLGYITDGYTRKFYIAPQPGVHDEVRGEVRPLTVPERAKAMHGTSEMPLEQVQEKVAGVMEQRIVSWSIGLPLKKATLLRLPSLFERLWRITCGLDAGDEDPQGGSEAMDEAADAKN